jgi:S-(hydroxymethyl)glutathione dehydrogenase/alcohol dehydrogenase
MKTDSPPQAPPTTPHHTLSRRCVLTRGAAAAVGGAALLSRATAPVLGQAPAVVTARRFRAWVGRGVGPGRTTLQDLTLRPIGGRQVLVRTEASNLCYSNAGAVVGLATAGPPPATRPGGRQVNDMAVIQGHGGVGVVEAVGPEVRRVRVGDRVCVSGTPQCGSCYQCLRGRADVCQFLSRIGPDDWVPVADTRDGIPVFENSHIGGLAELMVAFEEWVVPVFTTASAVDLGMVCSCVAVAGLGASASNVLAQIEAGDTVAIVGCGPLGLSAVQGARIAGASRIIAIDPIRVRRDVALKVGATHVLDPNVEGARVIDRVRAISMDGGPGDRYWAGGRDTGGRRSGSGADFVIEAAGFDQVPPKLEAGPDPTGLVALQQAYQMCATGGHVVTTSLVRGNVTLPGTLFTIGGISHHGGQAGGANPMRDIPRFVELFEKGQFDTKTLATRVASMADMLAAYEEVLYRTTITAILIP